MNGLIVSTLTENPILTLFIAIGLGYAWVKPAATIIFSSGPAGICLHRGETL